jgi:hypothetical protein
MTYVNGVSLVAYRRHVYLGRIVLPRTKHDIARLIVEREQSDVVDAVQSHQLQLCLWT